MGLLAESKSRTKISKDPNNTKWTRDTNTFGQKIMRAQGWQPGQYLGAHNAAQSESYTAANASYIRVTLKDDMKGLGFNKAKEDEITGLDVFSDLLSRLNGKSDEAVEGDRQARLAVKTHRYVEAKWGPMRFVRGGLLVGDELKEEAQRSESAESPAPEEPKKSRVDKKSKKRKAAEVDDTAASEDTEKAEKRRRKEERRAKKAAAAASEGEEERESKKKSRSEKDAYPDGTVSDDAERTKRKSKKEKKSKSESRERPDKKEKTKNKKAAAGATDVSMDSAADSAATGTSTPTESGTGTSTPRGSRNFVRSRFIAQKRQAVLDAKALNQIFMLKT